MRQVGSAKSGNGRSKLPAIGATASGGVSCVESEVTRMTFGPTLCKSAIAALAASSVPIWRPVRYSSSNRFGVITSAAGTALSRMNSGMPGRT